MSPPSRMRAALACLIAVGAFQSAVLAQGGGGGAGGKLDDAWFFPERPAGLKALEGKAAPELKLKTWIGDKVSVPDSRGKVVVIDFWATWCGPCMAAIPKNIEVVKKYKDQGLVFLGVHDANSGWDESAAVVKDKGINYPVARDEDGGLSAKAYALAFWPTYVVIDRAGIVRGAGLVPTHVEAAVKLLLAEPPPPGLADAKGGSGLGPEWFYGGTERPASLRALEGKPMPALSAAQWLGGGGADTGGGPLTQAELKDHVVVVHFLASGNPASLRQGEILAAVEKEMGPQGVVVVSVCPPEDSWDPLAAKAGEGTLPSSLCQDSPAGGAASGGLGATAAAFGVRFAPATVVIDRAGIVRAAGVRADKVKALAGKLLAEAAQPPPRDNAAPGGNGG